MKKLLVLSATAVLLSTASFAQTAQTEIKGDMKSLNQQEKAIRKEEKLVKKEKKADRKALRKLDRNGISSMTKEAFYKDFGAMNNVRWGKAGEFETATFMKDGKMQTAYYDYDAELVGTTSVRSFANLPEKAQKEINIKFGSYTKGKVLYFEDNASNDTDMALFGSNFSDASSYFIDLKKGNENHIYQVSKDGDVSFFKNM